MKTTKLKKWARPPSAWAVVNRSRTLEEFGRNLRDWLHELRRFTTRAQLIRAIRRKPPTLQSRLADGQAAIAEAFLAAQVEFLAMNAGVRPPSWVRDDKYVLKEPWFSEPSSSVRADLLVLTPAPFKNRNIFTLPEGSVSIRRGRPRVSEEQRRASNRDRQRRWRERQKGA